MVSVYSLIPLINSSFNLMPIDKLFMIWTEGSDSASKGAQNGRSPPQPLAAQLLEKGKCFRVLFLCAVQDFQPNHQKIEIDAPVQEIKVLI